MRQAYTVHGAAVAAALVLAASVVSAQEVDPFKISIGVRETGTSAALGENGGTSGGIEWVNKDGQNLVPDGTWQQFTFNFGSDPIENFAGGNGAIDVTKGTLEHIRLLNTAAWPYTINLYIDDIVNTTNANTVDAVENQIANGFEGTYTGQVMFREPSLSGSTSGNVASAVPIPSSGISTFDPHSGTQSVRMTWRFVDGDPNRWVRLTTFGTANLPNPTIDVSPTSTLSFWAKATLNRPSNEWQLDADGVYHNPDNWTAGTVPGPVGATNDTAAFLDKITAPRTVTLTDWADLNGIIFDSTHSYTLVSASPGNTPIAMVVSSGGANPSIASIRGDHVIDNTIELLNSVSINTSPGSSIRIASDIMRSPSAPAGGATSIFKTGGGTLELKAFDTPNSFSVTGGTLKLTPSGGSDDAVSKVGILTAGTTSQLDITDNTIINDWTSTANPPVSPIGTIRARLASGYANGAWTGNGIMSSIAAADPLGLTAVGYADNADLGLTGLQGETFDLTSVIIRYTYLGDTDLDRDVDNDDYQRLLNSLTTAPAVVSWFNGDLNYDGVVDRDDLSLMDYALRFAGTVDLFTPVPEPTALSLLALAIPAFARRRR